MRTMAQRLEAVSELCKRDNLNPYRIEFREDQTRLYFKGNIDVVHSEKLPKWARFAGNRRKNHFLVVRDE